MSDHRFWANQFRLLLHAAAYWLMGTVRGWLAAIAKERSALRQVVGYGELGRLFEFYQEFEIVPFDEPAARRFDELRAQKLRVGTMDLKIAAIALVHNALLLSANKRDFEQVPGLRVENWLD